MAEELTEVRVVENPVDFNATASAETPVDKEDNKKSAKKAKKGKKPQTNNKNKKESDSRDKRQWVAEVNKISAQEKADKKRVADATAKAGRAGKRKSLKSSR